MPTTPRLRLGDVREDGKVFVRYSSTCKGGEYWVTRERFESLQQSTRKARSPSGKVVTVYTNPVLRLRPYQNRTPRKIIQKKFDTPLPPLQPPATMNPETIDTDLIIIPNFSKYGISPSGNVYRVQPATRGKTAGLRHRVTPVIHPRGHQWCVQLVGDDNVRKRMPIKKLMQQVFGNPETIS
jgi:hypothetical protein